MEMVEEAVNQRLCRFRAKCASFDCHMLFERCGLIGILGVVVGQPLLCRL